MPAAKRPHLSWPRKPLRGRLRETARRILLRALVRERARGAQRARIQMEGLLPGVRFEDGSLLMVSGCPDLRVRPSGLMRRHDAWRARRDRVRPPEAMHFERYRKDGTVAGRALIRLRRRP